MFRSFKPSFYSLLWQPGRTMNAAGLVAFSLAVAANCTPLFALSLILFALASIWQAAMTRRIDDNFAVMPSMPLLDGRPYYFLFQKRREDASTVLCQEQLRSLIRDKLSLGEDLPRGRYLTITHDTVLKVFDRCDAIRLDGEPVPLYRKRLGDTLNKQMNGRCRRCAAPCAAYRSEPRAFYLVRFTVV